MAATVGVTYNIVVWIHACFASKINTDREHASSPATTSLQANHLIAYQGLDDSKPFAAQYERCSGPQDHSDPSQDNPVKHESLHNATDLHKKRLLMMHDGDSDHQRNRSPLTSLMPETDQA